MKKVLSLVLAIMMVVSMTTVAFATTFEDVTNADQAQAVEALVALGIVNGYEDGTYKPEKVVTRAEMAKMLIVALGYESIANDTPAFTDAQNHWAKGFIALASDLGVVNGRGNGIFDPDATVTYQEASVMMLRALGYTDTAINNGKSEVYNAGNYKTKALSLGLFDDLSSFSFNSGANRGDIASMLFASLSNYLVEINPTTGLAQFVIENKEEVALISKLATREEGYKVDVEKANAGYTADLSDYLLEEVVVYSVGSGSTYDVIFVEGSLNRTVEGYVSEYKNGKLYLNGASTGYTVPVTSGTSVVAADVVLNGSENDEFATSDLTTDLDNVKVVYDANKNVTGLVVERVDSLLTLTEENQLYVSGRNHFVGKLFPVVSGKPSPSSVILEGVDTFEDIQLGDIVQICMDGSKIYKVYVTSETVEGAITKIDTANGLYYVDGVAYELNLLPTLTVKPTLQLTNGRFYLDKDGYIANYEVITTTSNTKTGYGILSNTTKNGVLSNDFGSYTVASLPQVKIMSVDGTVKAYEVAVSVDTEGKLKSSGNAKGFTITPNTTNSSITISSDIKTGNEIGETDLQLVKYTVNADGIITAIDNSGISDVTNKLKSTSPEFIAKTSDNTKVVAYTSTGFKVLDIDDIASETSMQVIGTASWSYVILPSAPEATTVNNYAMIKSASDVNNADGDPVAEVVLLLNGEEQTLLTTTEYSAKDVMDFENKMVKVTLNKDNVITVIGTELTEVPGTIATAITSKVVTIAKDAETNVYPALSSNVVVYRVVDGVATLSSIDEIANEIAVYLNASIVMYDATSTPDGVVDVIVLK